MAQCKTVPPHGGVRKQEKERRRGLREERRDGRKRKTHKICESKKRKSQKYLRKWTLTNVRTFFKGIL